MRCGGSGKIKRDAGGQQPWGEFIDEIEDCPGCDECQPKRPPCYGTGVMRSSSGNYMPCFCPTCHGSERRAKDER